jgi:hypothetical protein
MKIYSANKHNCVYSHVTKHTKDNARKNEKKYFIRDYSIPL